MVETNYLTFGRIGVNHGCVVKIRVFEFFNSLFASSELGSEYLLSREFDCDLYINPGPCQPRIGDEPSAE